MEFTFEDKLNYIETVLGLKLLDWQREALKIIDKGGVPCIVHGRGIGRDMLMRAVKLLKQLNESLINNEGWNNDNLTFQREYEMRFE